MLVGKEGSVKNTDSLFRQEKIGSEEKDQWGIAFIMKIC